MYALIYNFFLKSNQPFESIGRALKVVVVLIVKLVVSMMNFAIIDMKIQESPRIKGSCL